MVLPDRERSRARFGPDDPARRPLGSVLRSIRRADLRQDGIRDVAGLPAGAASLSKQRLLFVSTGHHSIRPGGLESYVRDLYEALRASDEFEPILLARAGEPFTE